MNIVLYNNSMFNIIVDIGFGEPKEIKPNSKTVVPCPMVDKLSIKIRRNINSIASKGKYYLVIETKYRYFNIKKGEVFTITREKIRLNSNVYYDRLFLHAENAIYISESHSVLNEIDMKKSFVRSRRIRFLFVEPLEYLPGLFIALLILGIILFFKFGWIFAIVYFSLSYLLMLAINLFSDKLWNIIIKKEFNLKDDKKEFWECFDSEFISSYYSNPYRAAYMDEVEM